MMSFTSKSIFIVIPPVIWIKFYSINLHLHLHEICLDKVFDSFIPVTMSKTLRYKSSALFGIHTLSEKSLRVLKITTYLSNLNANG